MACVPLLDQFGHGPGGKQRDVIGMWLNRDQDFAGMRGACACALNYDIVGSRLLGEGFHPGEQNSACRCEFRHEVTAFHSYSSMARISVCWLPAILERI